MTRWALSVMVVLVLANTAGTVLLLEARRPGAPRLAQSQLIQVDKLFRIASDFQRELENVTGQATYENDTEKKSAKDFLRDHTLSFAQCRIEYEGLKRSGTVEDLLVFVRGILYTRGGYGGGLVDSPSFSRFVAAKYEGGRVVEESKMVAYANASKLEALQEEFKVLAKSLLDDIK